MERKAAAGDLYQGDGPYHESGPVWPDGGFQRRSDGFKSCAGSGLAALG